MATPEEIKRKLERGAKALSLRPGLGIGSAVSRTRITSGLACEVTEGDWTFTADTPREAGGEGSAPSPGVFGRAALGGCLAMGYMMQAAKMEVAISSLEVEIEADFDEGGLFGTSDARPGYTEVRYTVHVVSNAPEEAVMRVLDEGDRLSPYRDVFANPAPLVRSVEIRETS